MNEYRFNQVLFIPDDVKPLKYDGKEVHMQPLLVKLLTYMVENPGKNKKRDEIISAVWGPGEHSYAALTKAVHALNELLPDNCRISTAHRVGYNFQHLVKGTAPKYKKIEWHFKHTPKFRRCLKTLVAMACLGFLLNASYVFTQLYYDFNPPVFYELIKSKAHFVRDYVIGTPQLSPDKRFLAHRATRNMFVNDKLALLDLTNGDIRPLISIGFKDGYKWNLAGDKIIYQKTTTGECEIRLLIFHDADKKHYSDKDVTHCDENSGQISFSWYNEHEFLANFVADNAESTTNNLPFHHLYSFNVETGAKKLVRKAEFKGGFGFYSLEFDRSTKRVHFLQTNNFDTTDFYYYDGEEVINIGTVDQYVPFYAVDNNKLVYKNKKQRFVINVPADDLSNPQEFLRPQLETLNKPHLMGDQLVYVAGHTYGTELQQFKDEQLSMIETQGFHPYVLASYNNQLVFTAMQTGIEQVYMLDADNSIIQMSDMQVHEDIEHIEIGSNIFVLSYENRVDVYRLQNAKLKLLETLPNYTQGVIHQNGETILLSYTNDDGDPAIVEKRLNDFSNTGKNINKAKFAFYHHDDIVYCNQDKELTRLRDGHMIASNIKIKLIANTDISSNSLYFIEGNQPKKAVSKIDLTTGEKSSIAIGDLSAFRLQVINERLFISAIKALRPTLITGQLSVYEP